MSYKIQFVTDEEFEQLPGKDMHDKVGVAYPKYGEAYVRKSGSNVVDIFSAMHELEHLKGNDLDEHYDSENECYYKGGFMQALMPALAGASFLIPGVGPAIGGAMSSMMGGLGGAASGLGGLFSGALGSVPGIGGALSGGANAVGGALGSAASGAGAAASKAGSAFAGAGKSAQSALGMGGAGASGNAMSGFGVPSVASGGEQAASLGGQLGAGPLATPAAAITGGGAGAGLGGGVGGALSKAGGIMNMANMGSQAMNAFGGHQQNPSVSMMNQFQAGQQMPQQPSQGQPNVIQTGVPNQNQQNQNGFLSGRSPWGMGGGFA